jgi:MFS transporter, DHA1 family, multidrug resistance protein
LEPWRRNFHAVWPSLFATSMGLMAFLPTLSLYVRERFGIADAKELAFWAGIIYGAAPFSAALAGPIWGALGDRVGKRPMAIRANLAIAITTGLMPLASTPLLLLLMRAVQGVLAGYVAPAMALVSQSAPRELHGIVIARLQVAMAMGAVLGPWLGGVVNYFFGRAALFWVTSVLSAFAALQLHRRAEEVRPIAGDRRASFHEEMWRAILELLSNRVFAGLLVLVLVLRLGQNMLEPFIALFVGELGAPVWMQDFAGFCLSFRAAADPVGAATGGEQSQLALELTISAAFGIMGFVQLVFTPWWGRLADRFGPLRCLGVLGLCLAAILAATATVASANQFLLLRTAAACMMAGSMTLAYAAASKRVADGRRTLAFSLVQSCMQLGFGLGPQIGGFVAVFGTDGLVNFRQAYVAAAVLCLGASVGMFALRRVRIPGDLHATPP